MADSSFTTGANLPWVGYGTDFGTSAWHPEGGLSARPAALRRLDDAFARLAHDQLRLVRVFIGCDGRSGIRFDQRRLPVGLDDLFFSDVDALLASARQHGIRLMPVLFDFHLSRRRRIVSGVQLGGRAHLIDTRAGRAALADAVVRPLARRYGGDDTIAAWDLMNEPEWCLPRWVPRRRRRYGALQDLLSRLAACVREEARQPITVGLAGTRRLDLVRRLHLDFYQVHWYEKFGWPSLERPVAALGLDRPVLLGEFSGRSRHAREIVQMARHAGYSGALFWSVLAEDPESGYPSPDCRH